MKKIFSLFVFVTISLAVIAQKNPCTSNTSYRNFDFWIGEWEAFDTKGNLAGNSKVSLILDSCIILEEWTSTQGNYTGKSFNTFNAATYKWQQYWVDNKGGILEFFNGSFTNNEMVLQTANVKQPDGTYKISKMTFTRLNNDKVRQHGEKSNNEGTTWVTEFDLEYRRKK